MKDLQDGPVDQGMPTDVAWYQQGILPCGLKKKKDNSAYLLLQQETQFLSTDFASTSKTTPSHLIAPANNTRVYQLTLPFPNPADVINREYHSHQCQLY